MAINVQCTMVRFKKILEDYQSFKLISFILAISWYTIAGLKQHFCHYLPLLELFISEVSSTSLFRQSRLSVHPMYVRPSVTKFFFCLNRLKITPWLLGSTPGLTPGTPGPRSPSGGARICPRSGHFLVFYNFTVLLFWRGKNKLKILGL